MFEETITTKNGVEKRVVASSKEELDEAVKAAKAEETTPAPDINNPKDGNKVVPKEEDTHKYAADQAAQHKTVDNQVAEEEPKQEKAPTKVDNKKK